MLLDDFTIGEDTTLPDLLGRINLYLTRPNANQDVVIRLGPDAFDKYGWDLDWPTSTGDIDPWLVEIRTA